MILIWCERTIWILIVVGFLLMYLKRKRDAKKNLTRRDGRNEFITKNENRMAMINSWSDFLKGNKVIPPFPPTSTFVKSLVDQEKSHNFDSKFCGGRPRDSHIDCIAKGIPHSPHEFHRTIAHKHMYRIEYSHDGCIHYGCACGVRYIIMHYQLWPMINFKKLVEDQIKEEVQIAKNIERRKNAPPPDKSPS